MPGMPCCKSQTILVTGCSKGGLGAAMALALAMEGHHVFATARDTAKIPSDLARLTAVTTLQLDITCPKSIAAAAKCVADATSHQGSYGLDVLINNAGRGYTMPVLDIDIDEAKIVYDTNVWGPVRTTQAFADLLIAKHGRVVNIGSANAGINPPWTGVYSSSKSALASLFDTLRLELTPFGVSIITIVLGPLATPFHDNQAAPALRPRSRYISILDTITRWSKGEEGPPGRSVDDVAQSLLPDILDGRRNGEVWKGEKAGLVDILSPWLPAFILDGLASRGRGLEQLRKTVKE